MSILQVTERAKQQLHELMAQAPQDSLGIRLSLKKGGCSGYEYKIEYADKPDPMDEVSQIDGLNIYIPVTSFLFLLGARMDYESGTFSEGFTFQNPNESGRCGCGESVSFDNASTIKL